MYHDDRFTDIQASPQETPALWRILDFTCGEKEFWIVNGTGNFTYVKPAHATNPGWTHRQDSSWIFTNTSTWGSIYEFSVCAPKLVRWSGKVNIDVRPAVLETAHARGDLPVHRRISLGASRE